MTSQLMQAILDNQPAPNGVNLYFEAVAFAPSGKLKSINQQVTEKYPADKLKKCFEDAGWQVLFSRVVKRKDHQWIETQTTLLSAFKKADPDGYVDLVMSKLAFNY